MTPQIATILVILGFAIVLFITEKVRIDLVALLVLACLALTSLVTPPEALSGFSNPAVVTVWAVFILSGGLSRTGVANLIGRQVLRLAGTSEFGLILVIMITSGVMSAFMNNVGVTALLLPVVVDISRQTGHPPSRLLMPLAYGSLMGGLNTLIGTPPNILISDAMREAGLRPFQMFDFATVGLAVMLAGTLFMVLFGRRLLPQRDVRQVLTSPGLTDSGQPFKLHEHLFVLRLMEGSSLAGKSLSQSRIGAILGLNILGIMRNGHTELAPQPESILQGGDRLVVAGRLDQLQELLDGQHLSLEERSLTLEDLTSTEIQIYEVTLSSDVSFVGQTLAQLDFRGRFGVNVLAIRQAGTAIRTNLQDLILDPGCTLLVQGSDEQLALIDKEAGLNISRAEVAEVYRLHERLLALRVPDDSALVGRTLVESRLSDAFGLTVLNISREGRTIPVPGPTEQIHAGDTLMVAGKPEDLAILRGLQDLELEQVTAPEVSELESEQVGLVETVLSPYSTLAGKSLRQLHFREKYGLSVLAVWRQGQAFHANLRDLVLGFGDAVLLFGPRQKLRLLASEPDFLVLTEDVQEPLRTDKAPLAGLLMLAVLLPVILGWLPISIAAVTGAALMILLGCLTMDEAYRFIEWKAIFLIAGMLPLGIAMEQTGTARFLADGLVSTVGGMGPTVVVAGFFILATLASQVMPNPAVAVLMAPIALSAASDLGMSPYALMMTVALAASASFLSPVAHPSNVLIMGPGGYRFSDYIKVGLPITIVVLLVVLVVLPIFWPLVP